MSPHQRDETALGDGRHPRRTDPRCPRRIGHSRRELAGFGLALAALVVGFFHESLLGGKVLSPADVLFASASFREVKGPDYEPLNRLLMDPVLQFQPWLEFNRREIRAGRLPLWNPYAGCGAPHLANGQSAVFDPFHAIAYLGRLPDAYAPMAAARLWVAGIGMFLLAGHWGLGRWGRWFAGLVYPFSGFQVVWLLYPVTNVAIWFPWVVWASDRVLDRPSPRRVGLMAIVVGCCLLGGHVQTSAHVLVAAGLNGLWRWRSIGWRGRGNWVAGFVLGIGIAAVEVISLAEYLTKSPVWTDRASEREAPWARVRPRILDAACTAPARSAASAQPAAGASQPGTGPRGPQPERVGRGVRRAGDAPLARPAGVLGMEALASPLAPLPHGVRPARVVSLVASREPAPRDPGPERHRQPPPLALGRVRPEPSRRDRARPFGGHAARSGVGVVGVALDRAGGGLRGRGGRDRAVRVAARGEGPRPLRQGRPWGPRGRPRDLPCPR